MYHKPLMKVQHLRKTKTINLKDMNNAIIITNEELQQKIDEAVEKAMQKLVTPKEKRRINLDLIEAIEHLNSVGYKCSRSLLYKMTMSNSIPFEKFGRRISFNADFLTKWVETKKQKRVDVAGNVSRSANFKLR